MPEDNKETVSERKRLLHYKIRHRGRIAQILIILGKFFRMFVYQNDWKVFPMAALISGLLAYVIRNDFMKTMEGTLKGAFALTCVALWNGCFNSIQVICREREIVKREHRAGMHISSYILAHMIYQAVLCAGQTVTMLYVFRLVQISFPAEGFITGSFQVDIGITFFLITFAADMLALLISAMVHSTTGAMTVMPFILIFQLVFSGGVFALPSWTVPLSNITLSRHGLTCIAAQADYNHLPMVTAWNSVRKMRDTRIDLTMNLDKVLNLLNEDAAERSEMISQFRNIPIQDALDDALKNNNEKGSQTALTMGDLIDWISEDSEIASLREKEYQGSVTIGEIVEIFGEEDVKTAITNKSSQASQDSRYDKTFNNIIKCWSVLGAFAVIYALLALIVLEFIDKDKR